MKVEIIVSFIITILVLTVNVETKRVIKGKNDDISYQNCGSESKELKTSIELEYFN